jgi:hypothetical protein
MWYIFKLNKVHKKLIINKSFSSLIVISPTWIVHVYKKNDHVLGSLSILKNHFFLL